MISKPPTLPFFPHQHCNLRWESRPKLTIFSFPEEERKALIAMLGKLYITSNSDATKLESVNDLVIEAIDGKIATEAASRTALNKLHLAVGKARGEVAKTKGGARKSADETALVDVNGDGEEDAGETETEMDVDVDVDEDREAEREQEEEGEGEETVVAGAAGREETVEPSIAATKDSLLDDLLDDDDDSV